MDVGICSPWLPYALFYENFENNQEIYMKHRITFENIVLFAELQINLILHIVDDGTYLKSKDIGSAVAILYIIIIIINFFQHHSTLFWMIKWVCSEKLNNKGASQYDVFYELLWELANHHININIIVQEKVYFILIL